MQWIVFIESLSKDYLFTFVLKKQLFWITHGVIVVEDVTPFVLHKEEAVAEDEEHGEDDDDHHQQTAVYLPHPHTAP